MNRTRPQSASVRSTQVREDNLEKKIKANLIKKNDSGLSNGNDISNDNKNQKNNKRPQSAKLKDNLGDNNNKDNRNGSNESARLKRPTTSASAKEMIFKDETNKNNQSISTIKKVDMEDDHDNQQLKQTLSFIKPDPNDIAKKLIEENVEYFNHITGRCGCDKTNPRKQQCKQTSLKLMTKALPDTLYGKDFNTPKPYEKTPNLKGSFYNTFKWNAPMDFNTTNKNHFQEWKADPSKNLENTTRNINTNTNTNTNPNTRSVQLTPFVGKSNYKEEYISWGFNQNNSDKHVASTTIIPNLPFFTETTYKHNFGFTNSAEKNGNLKSPYQNRTQPIKPKSNNLQFTSGFPFFGESMSKTDYKPFKIGPNLNKPKVEAYHPTEPFPNQYESQYMKEFSRKEIPNKN